MKATEPARLLPLLVPALSETKGWHWQGGLGPHGREREWVSPPIQEGFLVMTLKYLFMVKFFLLK